MRTARLLSIAGLVGVALLAILLWSRPGPGVRDAMREQADPAREAVGRDPLHAKTRPETATREAAPPVFESSVGDGAHEPGPVADRVGAPSAAPAAPVELSFERARETLATAIAVQLPGLALSQNELDDLARATLRLRHAQAALGTLPKTREHARERALERRRLEEAVADFTYLVDMTPAEFTRRVAPDGGVDPWSPAAALDDVSIRPIRPTRASETPE